MIYLCVVVTVRWLVLRYWLALQQQQLFPRLHRYWGWSSHSSWAMSTWECGSGQHQRRVWNVLRRKHLVSDESHCWLCGLFVNNDRYGKRTHMDTASSLNNTDINGSVTYGTWHIFWQWVMNTDKRFSHNKFLHKTDLPIFSTIRLVQHCASVVVFFLLLSYWRQDDDDIVSLN